MKKTKGIFSVAASLVFALSTFTGCDELDSAANGWHYGEGAPVSSFGIDGDLYLDYSNWNVWTKENGEWKQRGNIKGDTGSQGGSGSQGSQGEKGSGWLYGEVAPENSLGADGDLYLNLQTWDVYTKESGAWAQRGNIKGDTGLQGGSGSQGSQGEKGSGWHYGNGAPENSLGADGDLFLNLQTWDVYTKDGGAWTFRDNINTSSDYYKDPFQKFTMTDGNLKVFGNGKNESENFFMMSIQGLFAQIGESKYYYNGGVPTSFLDELSSIYGKGHEDVTIDNMCEDYINHFSKGYVLYDIASAESTNCARTIAGADRLVMVSTDLESYAKEKGLYKVVDATEMTAEECFDQYKDKLSNEGLVYGDASNTSSTTIKASSGLTDYAIACRYFCYYPADQTECGQELDLELWSQAHPGHMRDYDDDWKPLRHKVYEWCAGASVFGGFPMSEVQTVKISSQYNCPVVVGSPVNLTVYGCVDFFGENVLVQKNHFEPITEEKYPLNKHYVTIVNGDGDNVAVHIGGVSEATNLMGAERGDFPMGWEMNPSLYSMAPNVVRHYYNSVKEGDSYVCSISGFGHTFVRYFDDPSLARLTSNLDKTIGACDLPVVKILDNGSMFDEAESRVLSAYAGMKNAQGFLYCTYEGAYVLDHGSVRWMNGKPIVSCRYTLWEGFGAPETIAASINASSKDSTKIDAYSYVNLHIWSKKYDPDVKALVAALGEDVVVVDPLTFIRLVKERVPHEDTVLESAKKA